MKPLHALPGLGRDVWLVAACQALFTGWGALLLSFNILAGALLAPQPSLATLPHAVVQGVSLLGTIPASRLLVRWGPRASYLFGAGAGALGCALCALAMARGSFLLLCIGSGVGGVFQAIGLYYKYSVADLVAGRQKSLAMAITVGAGTVGIVVVPSVGLAFTDARLGYALVYMVAGLLALGLAAIIPFVRWPRSHLPAVPPVAPPIGILVTPVVRASLATTSVAFAVMVLVMVASPLGMMHLHMSEGSLTGAIQAHLLAMYLPSLLTGVLIARWGQPRVAMAGLGIMAASLALLLAWQSPSSYGGGLVLLGLGWNLAFLAAASLLTGIPDERGRKRLQGVNEFLAGGAATLATGVAGPVFSAGGIHLVVLVAAPLLGLAALVVASASRGPARKQAD